LSVRSGARPIWPDFMFVAMLDKQQGSGADAVSNAVNGGDTGTGHHVEPFIRAAVTIVRVVHPVAPRNTISAACDLRLLNTTANSLINFSFVFLMPSPHCRFMRNRSEQLDRQRTDDDRVLFEAPSQVALVALPPSTVEPLNHLHHNSVIAFSAPFPLPSTFCVGIDEGADASEFRRQFSLHNIEQVIRSNAADAVAYWSENWRAC